MGKTIPFIKDADMNQGQTVIVQKSESNGMGIAGFICALIGLVTCGLTTPFGLLFSFIGLFKAPRGMAVAGFLISLVTALIALIVVAAIGIPAIVGGKMLYEKNQAADNAAAKILEISNFTGILPTDEEGAKLISGLKGPNDNPIFYKKIDKEHFKITLGSFTKTYNAKGESVSTDFDTDNRLTE